MTKLSDRLEALMDEMRDSAFSVEPLFELAQRQADIATKFARLAWDNAPTILQALKDKDL